MNRFMRTLYGEGVFIPRSRALQLVKDGQHFLRVYMFLAHTSLSTGQCLFALTPKVHMLQHLVEEVHHQCSKADWIWNVLVDACFIEEDCVGRLAYLTRCLDARTQTCRSIERYLVQLNVCLSMR